MTVVDAFVSVFRPERRRRFNSEPLLRDVQRFFGQDGNAGAPNVDVLVEAMDDARIDLALNTGGLLDADQTIGECAAHPNRLRAALTVDPVVSIRSTANAIETVAAEPLVAAIRVVPMLSGEPINSRCYYPIYERCESFGLPVTINVGVPGPKLRASLQDPMLLDDVLIDFPDLVVVGAHMGHPWEALLIRLMMKYENLYLSNSAYLARYMDPAVIQFMTSSRGRHKLIFASDEPLIPMQRAVDDARALAIDADAKDAFLGGNALRVFRWSLPPVPPGKDLASSVSADR